MARAEKFDEFFLQWEPQVGPVLPKLPRSDK